MSDAPARTSEIFLPHADARTNTYGRLAVERYLAGHRVKDIAAQLGISRTTVFTWIARYAAQGRLAWRTGPAGRTPARGRSRSRSRSRS